MNVAVQINKAQAPNFNKKDCMRIKQPFKLIPTTNTIFFKRKLPYNAVELLQYSYSRITIRPDTLCQWDSLQFLLQ